MTFCFLLSIVSTDFSYNPPPVHARINIFMLTLQDMTILLHHVICFVVVSNRNDVDLVTFFTQYVITCIFSKVLLYYVFYQINKLHENGLKPFLPICRQAITNGIVIKLVKKLNFQKFLNFGLF